MYVLLEFWQKIMAIPIMNPLSWFMIVVDFKGNVIASNIHFKNVYKVFTSYDLILMLFTLP